ncbi:signal recognition particle-docking protein FtsY [Pseudoalteromonas phenolica]|uniref:Signal recognition particle receptor FtsY n=1 Tax=Pseudoalteromonas phenolica TaxID=161398 RepID=A0A4Q7IRQ2_9GAMM|nr:signal recognition particle-docking protein FtsY [Pseudoalteromonas phenolica]RZQ54710.1 signal recognition particle-docking protein FtsY [Pseudoalteromonas phenolica]
MGKKNKFLSWLGFGKKDEEQQKAQQAEEQARLEAEKLAQEKAEQERIAKKQAEREEAERLALEAEAAEKARLEAERLEQERIAKEQAEREEAERLAREAEAAEQACLEAEKLEQERIAKEQAEHEEAERLAREAEAAEQARLEAEKLEQERIAKEQAEREEAERLAREAEVAEQARLEAEKLEQERIAKEQAEREEAERLAREAEAAEQARLEAERLEQERIAKEQAEREEAERLAREAEAAEQARLEAERLEQERIAKEQAEREEAERLAREAEAAEQARLEAERLVQERIAKEQAEREEAERLAREAEAAEQALLEAEKLAEEKAKAEKPKKEGFFSRLKKGLLKTKANIGSGFASIFKGKKIDDDLFEDLETQLLTADLGVDTTMKLIDNLTDAADRKQLKDGEALYDLMKQEMAEMLKIAEKPLEVNADKKPFVILMVGVNGVGKTTTIGKLAKQFQQEGKSVMLAAGDTFRAAAVEQLQVWGERNDIPVVAQHTGADSASVVFDAFQAAKARNVDVLIADTAGRLQNKDNLMQELEKIARVMKKLDPDAPHEVMLTIDAGTGQNAISQVNLFNKAVGLTGITLTKLDGTAKGGVIFAVADKFQIPIRYIGVGEGIDDLRTFKSDDFIEALFSQDD